LSNKPIPPRRSRPIKEWLIAELSLRAYPEVLDLQRKLVDLKTVSRTAPDIMLLVEHPAVFTLGRRGRRTHLLVAEDFLQKRGIEVVHVERGGDITYHGPGQLVGYPIVDLRSKSWGVTDFVELLEELMIRVAADYGVTAVRDIKNRGIWVANHKLGSVGIAIRKEISFHGMAINVNTSLEPFTWINPCGLEGVQATSLKRELGKAIPMEDIRQAACRHTRDIFGVELKRVGLKDLHDQINIPQEPAEND